MAIRPRSSNPQAVARIRAGDRLGSGLHLLNGRQVRTDLRYPVHTRNLADGMREVVRQAGYSHQSLVIDVVVRMRAHAQGHEIQVQLVPRAPGDVVVRTRCVTADTNAADERTLGIVEPEAA